MALLIDTSVLVDLEAVDGEWLDELLVDAGDEVLSIATMTASELLVGVRLADDRRRAKREKFVGDVFVLFPRIAFDDAAANIHSDLVAQFLRRKVKLPSNDLVIGATALAHGFGVLTADERSFPQMGGLTVRLRPKRKPPA